MEDEIGGAYSTHREMRNLYVLVGETVANGPLEDVGVDEIIILKWILEKSDLMLWTYVSQDMGHWRVIEDSNESSES
jgi:hypothetical protein